MTTPVLPSLIVVSGLLYIGLLSRGPTALKYLLKPGTMALVIALAWTRLDPSQPYDWLILAGLLFSVAGDVFLMLPSDRFLQGLIAFFTAHLLYIAAFTTAAPLALTWRDLVEVGGLGVLAFNLFQRLRPGVVTRGGPRLVLPVALYTVVISVMVWRGLALEQTLSVAGALLFYLSDGLLAWNRFARPFPLAPHAVMATYYAAQFCLALSL